MHQSLKNICDSLDQLAENISSSWTGEVLLSAHFGWSFPAIKKEELASVATNLADRIRKIDINELEEEEVLILENIPNRLSEFSRNTVQYFYNGNGAQAIPVYFSMIGYINSVVDNIFGWQQLNDNKAMPTQLANRLRSIKSQIDGLIPDQSILSSQIQLINNAVESAESLPTDLQSLKDAREKVDKNRSEAAELYGKIDDYHQKSRTISETLSQLETEAKQIVAQCEEAYRVTTSVGLAAAFDERAKRSERAMVAWVVGLLIALAYGSCVGASRIALMTEVLKTTEPQWGIIGLHIVLSLLSIGAPLWFAWLATKQINQHFRLSEDYAFKASISKAYEGYRREAARLDEVFAAQLFSSALSRLDEAPLRLVEKDTHGSPWHELLSTPSFKKAVGQIPELKKDFLDLLRRKSSNSGGDIENQKDQKRDTNEE